MIGAIGTTLFMRTSNFCYESGKLEALIDFSLFTYEKNILIQVFCGHTPDILKYVTTTLLEHLPHAICIGTTTDGEIFNQAVSTFKTIISLSVFEKSSLKTAFSTQTNSFECGRELASQLIEKDTKLLILFTDGTDMNAEEFLKGIETISPKTVICGGMAGDNGAFIQTAITSQKNLLHQGAIGVSLNSEVLQVVTDYKFDWKAIGVEHVIDKAIGNRIYQIDGMSTADFYTKYLGNNLSQTEFPLILENNGMPKARAVIAKHSDGSFSCGGNLNKGDRVKIGFGDAQSLLTNPIEALQNLHQIKAETFFIYSCMARRRYMPDLINLQAEPFANIAPTAGFFTYSEFFHNNGHNELLNQTLTVVALSENQMNECPLPQKNSSHMSIKDEAYVKTIQALTHLIQQSAHDYDEQSKRLEEQMKYSTTLLQSHKQFLRHTVHEMNLPLSVIMSNIELHEMEFGKSHYLENIEVGLKSIFSLFDDLSYLVRKDQISYFKRKIDLADYIRSRVAFFEQVALKAKAKLLFTHSEQNAFIYFNETKLQRIIDNNLTNAIKYTYENKTIEVSLIRKEATLCFIVASHSRKIQKPEMIFEEYYREEKAKDGFGLGLNLVKRICVEENVSIELTSDEELTTFTYAFEEDKR